MTSRATGCLALLCGFVLAGLATAGAAERAQVARTGAPADDRFPVATDARLGGDSARTRLVIDLSRTLPLTAFTLADPYRVVLDLPQVTFSLPPKAGEGGRGLVKAFRYGLVMQGGSRVVIDTSAPVRIDKAFVLDPIDNQPARLVLDLVATDRDSFMRNLALETRQRRPPETVQREPARRSDDSRPVVVLDPGHGGPDTGTIAASGEMEKAMVLDFALALRERLEKTGKYRVHMTRTDDRFIPLAERVRIARSQEAALFISIHADALARNDGETRGATVYTLSEDATDAEAARLAEAENRADVIAGVDLSVEPNEVADILIDLAQRETKNFSAQFARTLVGELKTAARLHKKPIKSAGFRVLKAPDVPSVLVELGYVSNPKDLKLLMSEAWRSRVTESIAQAINTYFTTRVAGQAPGRRAN
ncbi:MAG: N-acetylmuramoyl-L-alanine amidase [Bradyrhizobiaceae bacterium]|nr:MAG: N-acetylmuramoyl-L-alanine amidase [Bradyrhizobiaceae bacterium]